jgi:NAD(P)-dependent dehydrogenase (short-subunit alcohol dehydrogenase family)
VVVNDLGTGLDGQGRSGGPAEEVAEEIRALGSRAVVDGHDVADFDGARQLIGAAVEAFGHVDVVVNNAGFVRNRMFVNLTEDDWDDVVRVHLKGHFCVGRWAASYWRDRAKAGELNEARIINTSAGAGLLGSVGHAAYSAAQGGILSLTLVQAAELEHYGVTVNAVVPAARTRMTEDVFADSVRSPDDGGFDSMAPENVAPLVVWLGSAESSGITGRVFEVEGGKIGVADGWQHGPTVDKGARWKPGEIGPAVRDLLAAGPTPAPAYRSLPVPAPGSALDS